MAAAPYFRKRLIGYGIGLGLSLLSLPVLHAAMGGVKGHSNPAVVIPALGIMLARVAALVFAVLWVATFVSWHRAGRPRAPF